MSWNTTKKLRVILTTRAENEESLQKRRQAGLTMKRFLRRDLCKWKREKHPPMSLRPHFPQLPGPALMFTKGQVIIKGKGNGHNKPRTQEKEATPEYQGQRGQLALCCEEMGRTSWGCLHRWARPHTHRNPLQGSDAWLSSLLYS